MAIPILTSVKLESSHEGAFNGAERDRKFIGTSGEITLTFRSDQDTGWGAANIPQVELKDSAGAVLTPSQGVQWYSYGGSVIGLDWQTKYIIGGSEAEGLITFTIDFENSAGESGVQVTSTSDNSTVEIDLTPPVITNVVATTDNSTNNTLASWDVDASSAPNGGPASGSGNVVTVSFTSNKALYVGGSRLGYGTLTGDFGHTISSDAGASEVEALWKATWNHDVTNSNAIVSHYESQDLDPSGDTGDVHNYVMISNPVASSHGMSSSQAGPNHENLTFTMAFTDSSGNAVSVGSTSLCQIHTRLPAIDLSSSTSLYVTSNNTKNPGPAGINATGCAALGGCNDASAKIGDTITIHLEFTENIARLDLRSRNSAISYPPSYVEFSTSGSGKIWTASNTITNNDVNGYYEEFWSFFVDESGNPSQSSYQSAQDSIPAKVCLDVMAPTINSAFMTSSGTDNTKAEVGDTITLSFGVSLTVDNNWGCWMHPTDIPKVLPDVVLTDNNGAVLSGTLNHNDYGGGTYTYTVQSGDAMGEVGFTIDFEDYVGNEGLQQSDVLTGQLVTINDPTTTTVAPAATPPSCNTTLTADVQIGDTEIEVDNQVCLEVAGVGSTITIGSETVTITGFGSIQTSAFTSGHTAGDAVLLASAVNTTTTSGTSTTDDPNTSINISPAGGGAGGAHLDCIRAKGVQLKKNYFAENINYSDTLLTTLEIRFVSGKKASAGTFIEDLEEWKNHIDNIAGIGLGEWRPGGITIYGLSFLNCKITSANFPTTAESRQNGVFGGNVTIQIEERTTGDTSNLAGRGNYDTLADQLGLYGDLIDDLSEDFEFTLDKGTQYGFTHSVNIRLTELAAPQLAITQGIAMEILNPVRTASPSFGFAFNPGSYATFAPTVHPYYSESVDLASGDYTLTKTFKTYADQVGSAPAYTYELTHSITQDQSGIVSITESGKVKAKLSAPMGVGGWTEAGRFKHSKDGVADLLTTSYARCNDLYSGGFLPNQSFGVAAPVGQGLDPDTNLPLGPLNLRPLAVNTTKNLDAISQECSYSVTYTDDPSQSWTLLRNVQRESTISCTQDSSGNVQISENVSITNAGDKDAQPVDILSLISEDHGLQASEGAGGVVSNPVTFGGVSNWNNLSGTRERVQHFYTNMLMGNVSWTFPPFTFKLVGLNYEYNVGGKTGGYSAEFTSDSDIFEPAQSGIKRINLSVEDNFPMRQYQEYPIPQWKVLIQDPAQTSVGTRVVTANLTLERVPFMNRVTAPSMPADALSYAAGEIRTKMLNIYMDYTIAPLIYPGQALPMHYVSNQEYSFDSKGAASVQATMSFIQQR